jgi:translation initiation factor IF-3
MRIGLKISDHDLEVKLNKVSKFLEIGHKVKLSVVYHGRELAHKELGFKLAERIIASYGDTIAVDQAPQLAGKQLSFVIRSNQNAKAKNA